jgi:hypothetical protein
MAGVYIIGREKLMTAYDEVGGGPWALFQARKLIVSGDDPDKLEKWLEMFNEGTANAFTLRVYEDATPVIKPNTDYIASFDFRFAEYAGYGAVNGPINQRLDKIEKQLNGDDEPDDEINFGKIINGWLKNPEDLNMVVGTIVNAFRQVTGKQPVISGGVVAGPAKIVGEQEKLQRLSVALDQLEKADSSILLRLEKLAAISKDEPEIFKALLKKLDNF